MKKIIMVCMCICAYNAYTNLLVVKPVSPVRRVRQLPKVPVTSQASIAKRASSIATLSHPDTAGSSPQVLKNNMVLKPIAPVQQPNVVIQKPTTLVQQTNVITQNTANLSSKIGQAGNLITAKVNEAGTYFKSKLVNDATGVHALGLRPRAVARVSQRMPDEIQKNPSLLQAKKLEIAEQTPLLPLVRNKLENTVRFLRNKPNKPLILDKSMSNKAKEIKEAFRYKGR